MALTAETKIGPSSAPSAAQVAVVASPNATVTISTCWALALSATCSSLLHATAPSVLPMPPSVSIDVIPVMFCSLGWPSVSKMIALRAATGREPRPSSHVIAGGRKVKLRRLKLSVRLRLSGHDGDDVSFNPMGAGCLRNRKGHGPLQTRCSAPCQHVAVWSWNRGHSLSAPLVRHPSHQRFCRLSRSRRQLGHSSSFLGADDGQGQISARQRQGATGGPQQGIPSGTQGAGADE